MSDGHNAAVMEVLVERIITSLIGDLPVVETKEWSDGGIVGTLTRVTTTKHAEIDVFYNDGQSSHRPNEWIHLRIGDITFRLVRFNFSTTNGPIGNWAAHSMYSSATTRPILTRAIIDSELRRIPHKMMCKLVQAWLRSAIEIDTIIREE